MTQNTPLAYRLWRQNKCESWRGGAHVWCKASENFLWSCPSTFLVLQVQLVVLVGTFGMASSLVSFLFAVLLFSVPLCPAICKSGGKCPSPCHTQSAPLYTGMYSYYNFQVTINCLKLMLKLLLWILDSKIKFS